MSKKYSVFRLLSFIQFSYKEIGFIFLFQIIFSCANYAQPVKFILEPIPATKWTMWDLALVEAIIHPEYAKVKKVLTPPENVQRKINMYTWIYTRKMEDDFWQSYKKLMKKLDN